MFKILFEFTAQGNNKPHSVKAITKKRKNVITLSLPQIYS